VVTAALSVLLGSNWPVESFSLWVEIHALICDQFLAELLVSEASAYLLKCIYLCEHMNA